MIQLSRFMLAAIDVDLCASWIETKLNSWGCGGRSGSVVPTTMYLGKGGNPPARSFP